MNDEKEKTARPDFSKLSGQDCEFFLSLIYDSMVTISECPQCNNCKILAKQVVKTLQCAEPSPQGC